MKKEKKPNPFLPLRDKAYMVTDQCFWEQNKPKDYNPLDPKRAPHAITLVDVETGTIALLKSYAQETFKNTTHHKIIERYTFKFGPVLTQKELKKALHESGDTPNQVPDLKKMKARIEVVGDFEDLRAIDRFLCNAASQSSQHTAE